MARDDTKRTSAKAAKPSRGSALMGMLRGLFAGRRPTERVPETPARGAREAEREPLYTGDRDERIDTREIPAGASSGRSGSRTRAKTSASQKTGPTERGAASSGERRGTTTGPRRATRTAGAESSGTGKTGVRRGSNKSRSSAKSRASTPSSTKSRSGRRTSR